MSVPGGLNELIIGSNSNAGNFQITRSLRGQPANSTYLTRTPGVAGNRRKFTFSTWIRPWGLATGITTMFGSSASSTHISFQSNQLYIQNAGFAMQSSRVFRDPTAWQHFVSAWDIDNATASNRIRNYVNGVEITSWGTDQRSSMSGDTQFNATTAHYLFRLSSGSYLDAYMAETVFIDGQQLTPSSFAATDATTGAWNPIDVSGLTYGTNGFYLKYADNSSVSALGTDSSGNSNTWTVSGFSVTAGTANDSLTDTPTNYGTDTGAGGEVRGNYATLNPLDCYSASYLGYGNLGPITTAVDSTYHSFASTFPMSSGKWYVEWRNESGITSRLFGVMKTNQRSLVSNGITPGSTSDWYAVNEYNGSKVNNGSTTAYGTGVTGNGDITMMALDLDNGKIYWGGNGTWYNSGNPATQTNPAFTGLSGEFIAVGSSFNNTAFSVNFGQRPFAYTAPSGFKALCTQNLATAAIYKGNTQFDATVWTPTGTTQSITGLAFQPGFNWHKRYDTTSSHYLIDAVRGTSKYYATNGASPAAEGTDANFQSSFNSDGWTMGTNNYAGGSAVTWSWKANGAGSSNTAGSITTTASVNTTAGISVFTYTGNGTGGATIGHGLGAVPKFGWLWNLAGGGSLLVYHVNANSSPQNGYLELNNTNSFTTASSSFNNTAPTSTLITLGTSTSVNASSGNHIGVWFAEIAGFSKFGSYTGNGSTNGPVVYCGFRPRFILTKRVDTSSDWQIIDTARNTYNSANTFIFPNLSNAGATDAAYSRDILSNGFKIRAAESYVNGSGGTFIYAAWAESPFNISRAS